ncbi:hypothetical protein ACTMS0_03435 [Micromonospora sp. H33]|uniref:hypothetical protein n=1 Tax=Micromonospora sp. H33 TaxID=3452215 RepID=UPI003F8CD593
MIGPPVRRPDHERDQLAEALREANARYTERYRAALQCGWTADDLAKLGLDAPESGPARRRRPPRPTPPSAHQPGEQATPANAAHP